MKSYLKKKHNLSSPDLSSFVNLCECVCVCGELTGMTGMLSLWRPEEAMLCPAVSLRLIVFEVLLNLLSQLPESPRDLPAPSLACVLQAPRSQAYIL